MRYKRQNPAVQTKSGIAFYWALLFIVYFTLLPFAFLFNVTTSLSENASLVYGVSFFFASLPFVGHFGRFLLCWVASLLLPITISIVFNADLFHGYAIFAVIEHATSMAVGAGLGCFCACLYRWILENYLGVRSHAVLDIALLSVVLISATYYQLMKTSEARKLSDEISSRTEFIKRVSEYGSSHDYHELDTAKIIDLGIADGLYIIQDGRLLHGYRGEVNITSDNEDVSIEYTLIPNGETCESFYRINRPSDLGFRDVYVNEVLVPEYEHSYSFVPKEETPCYANGAFVSIRYSAPLTTQK